MIITNIKHIFAYILAIGYPILLYFQQNILTFVGSGFALFTIISFKYTHNVQIYHLANSVQIVLSVIWVFVNMIISTIYNTNKYIHLAILVTNGLYVSAIVVELLTIFVRKRDKTPPNPTQNIA